MKEVFETKRFGSDADLWESAVAREETMKAQLQQMADNYEEP